MTAGRFGGAHLRPEDVHGTYQHVCMPAACPFWRWGETATAEDYQRNAEQRYALRKGWTGWTSIALSVLFAAALATTIGPLLVLLLSRQAALTTGAVSVVALGGTGLLLRGLGERHSSSRLKEFGYYCGAAAYLATASVALANGLPRLTN